MNTNPNINIDSFKAWAKANKGLANTVLLAQAFSDVERERVAAYIAPVFAEYEFTDEDSGERITDPDRLYLCGDLDDAKCVEFYEACDTAHRAHGFDGPEGHCPALTAESLRTDAETVLIESAGEFAGVGGKFNRSLDLRAKVLKMALTVCLGDLK